MTDQPAHAEYLESLHLCSLPKAPDLVILRLKTIRGEEHNFALDRDTFTQAIKIWNFDLQALEGALKTGGPIIADPEKKPPS